MKLEKSRKILAASTIAAMLILIGAIIGYAATPSTNIWISSGVYPSASTYSIWREGSNYFAKNSLGQIIFDNSSFGDLFNDVSGSMTTGGKIFLHAGSYVADKRLNLYYDGTVIEGEGRESTTITAMVGMDDDVLYYENIDYIELRHFKIDGNKVNNAAGNGIVCNSTSNSVYRGYFLNIWVTSCDDNGIVVKGMTAAEGGGGEGFDFQNVISDLNDGHGLYLSYSTNDCKIYGGKYNQNGESGIYVNGSFFYAGGVHLGNNGENGIEYYSNAGEIVGCYIHKANHEAIFLGNGSNRIGIHNNQFVGSSYNNNGTYDAIHGDNIQRVTISGNSFFAADGYRARLIVNFTGDSGASLYNTFSGNCIYNSMTNETQVVDLGLAKSDTFSGNIINGGLTEYRETVGGKDAGDMIAHKLWTTPTGIIVSNLGNDTDTHVYFVFVQTITATQFELGAWCEKHDSYADGTNAVEISFFAFWRPP